MKTLVTYLGAAALGYLIASVLRSKKDNFSWTGKLLALVVTSLVFSMGLKIGGNEEVIGNLGQVGLYGLAFCYIPLIVTILSLHVVRKLMGYNHQGKRGVENAGTFEPDNKSNCNNQGASSSSLSFFKSSSFRYLVAVILGFLVGFFGVIKGQLISYDVLNGVLGTFITWALLLMVVLVGVDMGFDGNILGVFKSIGWRVIVFPLVTGIATLVSGLIIGIFIPLSFKEVLAIICTFCWYSLAPNIIMNAGYVTAGAIAFLANFLRVLSSLITIPLVAKRFGWLETVGMPVAASMDVCIGTITESTDKTIALYAFASGVVYTVLIPLIVPIIVG